MSRLTKKIENPQYMNDYELLVANDYHLYNKLGKLEDLMEKYKINDLTELKIALDYYEQTKKVEKITINEESDTFKEIQDLLTKTNTYDKLSNELGCPLEIVFKAIKDGLDGYLELVLEYDEKDGWYFDAIWKYNDFGSHYADILPLKDYGKTWWICENGEN